MAKYYIQQDFGKQILEKTCCPWQQFLKAVQSHDIFNENYSFILVFFTENSHATKLSLWINSSSVEDIYLLYLFIYYNPMER